MSPGDGSLGMANGLAEKFEDGNLVGQRLLNRPTGGGVRRTCQREAAAQHERARRRIADIFCGIGGTRCYVAVAVKKQRTVPVCWNLDEIGCAIGFSADVLGPAGLRQGY